MAKKTDNCPICGRVMEKGEALAHFPTPSGVWDDATRLDCEGENHIVHIYLRKEEPTDANASIQAGSVP